MSDRKASSFRVEYTQLGENVINVYEFATLAEIGAFVQGLRAGIGDNNSIGQIKLLVVGSRHDVIDCGFFPDQFRGF